MMKMVWQFGILDVNDTAVNDYFPADKMRVPFRNIVYIGDSDTDIPSMKLVNTYGGHAIGVYNPVTGNKEKVYRMMRDNRIRYFAPADYRKGQQLEQLIQTIIDKTAAYEKLEALHIDGLKEMKITIKLLTKNNFVVKIYINAKERACKNYAKYHSNGNCETQM